MTGTVQVVVPLDDGNDADEVVFTVRGLDRTEWAALIHQHPTADPRWRWDAGTLYPALVAACTVTPAVDLDWAVRLVDDPDVGGDLIEMCLQLTEPGSLEWAKRRLATDARLAAEVAAAVRMGIPHSAFTDWPTASQDLALAHLEMRARVCPGCGVPEADMRDPLAWEPDARECWHCDTLEKTRAVIPEEARHKVHVHLVPAQVT